MVRADPRLCCAGPQSGLSGATVQSDPVSLNPRPGRGHRRSRPGIQERRAAPVTIGVLCAIPQELVHLRDALAHPWGEEVAHTRFEKGALDGHEVVLAGAGIGKVNTALVATILADRFRCRTIVFSGVAGGLDPALRI